MLVKHYFLYRKENLWFQDVGHLLLIFITCCKKRRYNYMSIGPIFGPTKYYEHNLIFLSLYE